MDSPWATDDGSLSSVRATLRRLSEAQSAATPPPVRSYRGAPAKSGSSPRPAAEAMPSAGRRSDLGPSRASTYKQPGPHPSTLGHRSASAEASMATHSYHERIPTAKQQGVPEYPQLPSNPFRSPGLDVSMRAGPVVDSPIEKTASPHKQTSDKGASSVWQTQQVASTSQARAAPPLLPERPSSVAKQKVGNARPIGTPNISVARRSPADLDLLPRIDGMYRLLELFSEQGSGGVVDKVIISQESLSQLVNQISPGAYTSLTEINFAALDNVELQPVGLYGSAPQIVDFLEQSGAIDEEVKALLLAPPDEMGRPQPTLKTGLYFLMSSADSEQTHRPGYVLYWPEENTWDDNAMSTVRRNRVTFMRYLKKLVDQVVCLMSDEHSAAIVWDEEKEADAATDKVQSPTHSRLYTFQVQKTKEQEENVKIHEGFKTPVPFFSQFSFGPEDAHLAPRVVAGDTRQAIIVGSTLPDRIVEEQSPPRAVTKLALQGKIKDKNTRIQLEDDLDADGFNHLLELGLRGRYSAIADLWTASFSEIQKSCDAEVVKMKQKNRRAFDADLPRLQKFLSNQLREVLLHLYPWAAHQIPVNWDASSDEGGVHQLRTLSKNALRQAGFTPKLAGAEYDALKQRFLVTSQVLGKGNLSADDYKRLDDAILTGNGFADIMKGYLGFSVTPKESSTTILGSLMSFAGSWSGPDEGELHVQTLMRQVSSEPDPVALQTIARRWNDRAPRAVEALIGAATKLIIDKINTQSSTLATRVSNEQFAKEELSQRTVIAQHFQVLLHKSLQKEKLAINNAELERAPNARAWKIHSISEAKGASKLFTLVETTQNHEPAHVEYTMYPISLSADDIQTLNADSKHVPAPLVRPIARWAFSVPLTSTLRHIQLFGNGRSLVVIDDHEAGKANVFLEEDNLIAEAILSQKTKKRLDIPRIGDNYMLAVDEPKRLFVIFSRSNKRLYSFSIDERFLSIQARSEVDLRHWLSSAAMSESPMVTSMLFINGSEELVITDDAGHARIFSLVTEQFRPASINLALPPDATFVATDGSCIFFVHKNDEKGESSVQVHHVASFGTKKAGTTFNIPALVWPHASLTSFGTRSNAYMVAWLPERTQLVSYRFQITTRISEFSFKAQDRQRQKDGRRRTRHNSILDVHSDVWARFPVASTIERSTPSSKKEASLIQFITSSPGRPFVRYFAQMVQQFEKSTQKPTQGRLGELTVEAIGYDVLHTDGHTFDITTYPAGKWLVELLCLIPIHIAITAGNRFVPLANGVISAEFERSLLGADVMQIANSITLGWYESIFTSYMATKPVKVVSSMGEQSVGKSYALNHFVDTSFAGSAMRCTEGAWLSVTPTDDELIVALDFEGLHSIERSAQEDMLLVLLNVAVSNMVLFRNNFALSRDLAGLFTSFQSSTSLIKPEQNPTLFRSTLCIIIKDVIDADSDEIVNEFFGKFQRIVHDEQEDNFITKLHGGKLDIIPWPVIQSQDFYNLMVTLKDRLDFEDSTHGNASMFLRTLKTFMAKLKASDWGSLDETLATHRAQVLQGMLVPAVIYGVSELDSVDGQLRNLDTNEIIQHDGGRNVFWLSQNGGHSLLNSRDEVFRDLREAWTNAPIRQQVSESEYTLALTEHLQSVARSRLAHVRLWLNSNLVRFSVEHSDIAALLRQFELLSRELTTSVEVCAMKCSNCGLKCVEGKRHEGDHDCGTNHRCLHLCSLEDKRGCGFGAGHAGEHICDVKVHLCGAPCSLNQKQGCQKLCTKPAFHQDGSHMCSSDLHACGEPCALAKVKREGKPLCTLSCAIDCRKEHEDHSCLGSTCPVQCQLCPRLCASQDHFHDMKEGAVHLCGQAHDCRELCSSPGICHVANEPRSVESTFVGRRETFQFTKYTQVANRHTCAQPIPPDKLRHEGPHIHSLKKDVFHFCETRCPFCSYYCDLPFGHAQEHSTSHGSMEQTSWSLEGDDSATREVSGRKFSSGDSGAPMLCSMVCKELGRHAHIDYCRSKDPKTCFDPGLQHISEVMSPNPLKPKDWVTHALSWARTGFKDPYSAEEQRNFAKCDSECAGDEHKAQDNAPAKPSFCTLPMFHKPASSHTRGAGYISSDGHSFDCRNPAVNNAAFHVIFVIDRSGSMASSDCLPLSGTPVTYRIRGANDNCFGAVLSALYGFWSARNAEVVRRLWFRRDAYSVILFNTSAQTLFTNDFHMTPDQLLNKTLHHKPDGGTDFSQAIGAARRAMENNWNSERAPVVIFLSDGMSSLPRDALRGMCERACQLGKPLSFHSVFFGSNDRHPSVLSQMADIARTAYRGGGDMNDPYATCTYTNAIDSIQLSQTFLGFAESMRQTRAGLVRS
ncbi:hypothetical protein DL93DRAFT_2224184 [Clavulina sp. PMI_390]|nr:hypothetical protein DL93DRAFT_2224184 [Clavulina sp. PMI_390]